MTRSDRRRTLTTLTVAQALGLSGGPLIVMLGGVVGRELAPSPGLATFPVAAGVAGVALASPPAALLMQRVGRRRGFAVGAALAAVGALLAAAAVQVGGFALFSLGSLLVGANLAFVMQYRFAAAEAGGAKDDARAVGLVLAGGIVAGLLGPEIARRGRDLAATPWVGSFLLQACVYALLVAVVLVGLERDDRPAGARPRPGRSLAEALRPARRPGFLLAASAGVVAYAVMALVMTATPVAMHVAGFDVDATALVIQTHVVAMYAPSLVAGLLVARVGLERLMAAGVVAMAACAVLSVAADGLGARVGGLVLLGLGWNVLFLGGTVTLARAFPDADRFRAQALNDGLVFGARALASLGAGFVLARGGWPGIHAVALAALSVMAGVLVARRLGRRTARSAPRGAPVLEGTGPGPG